jgi:phage gp16-like protein
MKPRAPQTLRDREIKLIHVARRELGLDEETYRAMLNMVVGVKSAADLDAAGRQKLLDHMKSKGFKVKSKAGGKAKIDLAADPQYRKIQALWSDLERMGAVRVNTEAAIRVYIKRITGCDAYAFCGNAQIASIIETLKKWRDRVKQPIDQVPVTESESQNG